MPPPPVYCPQCRATLALDAHGRRACPECEFVHYLDPKVAAVVVVDDGAGSLLYIKRNHEPALHRWCWPSGFVDAGEPVEAAAAREVWEETGLRVRLGALLGVWSLEGDPVVVVAYAGSVMGGTLSPGPEASDARWFGLGELPPPTFPHDEAILGVWRRYRRGDGGAILL